MPRAALTIGEIEAYRRRTIAAAMRLFALRGYEGVTMRALAAELGDSPMTPYRYFRDKDEIYATVRAEAFRRFGDAQREAFDSTQEPLERLFRMRAAYFDFALHQPNAYRVMFHLEQAPAERHPEVALEVGRAFGFLLDAVRAAIDAGVLSGDSLTVAHLLWANVHGLISLHLAGKLTMGRTLEDLKQTPGIVFLAPGKGR